MNKEIDKYFRRELTPKEEAELLSKISSDKEMQDEFAEQQRMEALLSFSGFVAKEDSQQKYQSFRQKAGKKKIQNFLLRATGYAAAIVLIIVSVHLYHVYNYQSDSTGNISFGVPAGQRISMTLQDGTVVYLNARTRLTYPTTFTGKERRVEVEGEAYFEVAHDSKKPFIVSSGGVEMKVLGTTFNVYNYPWDDFVRVSLIEGSLQVTAPNSGNQSVILKPNEQITIHEKEKLLVTTIPYTDYFLWKDGVYSFHNEPLGSIVNKLSMYYDVQIEVEDNTMLDWEYTGKFRQSDGIDEILRLMQRIYYFGITKQNEENRILLNK